MVEILTYERFNLFSKKDSSYYEEIDHAYILDVVKRDVFYNKEIDSIRKRVKSELEVFLSEEDNRQYLYYKKRNNDHYILKNKDEWYYIMVRIRKYHMDDSVSIRDVYYKCDQFDGLLKCLEDKPWNKPWYKKKP